MAAIAQPAPMSYAAPERASVRLTGGRDAARARRRRAVEDGGGELRLTARGRRVLAVVAVLLAVAVGTVGGRAMAGEGSQEPAFDTVTVTSGDTLWGIAQAVAEPGQDVRDVVASLVRINGLDSVEVQAGQSLLVPGGSAD